MTFQNTPDGVCPMEVVAACPQSNNESNKFMKEMELAAIEAVHSSGNGVMAFTSFAVDADLISRLE